MSAADRDQQIWIAQSDMLLQPNSNFLTMAKRSIVSISRRDDVHTSSIDAMKEADDNSFDALENSLIEASDTASEEEKEAEDARVAAIVGARAGKLDELIADGALKKVFRNFLVRLRDGEIRKNDLQRWMPEVLRMREEGVLR